MSQAGIINTSSGPVPPAVATSYVTDVNSPSIPALNIENVVGGSVTTNNINGIQTDGSSGGPTLTVELTNRFTGSTNTGNAIAKTVGTLVLQNAPGVYNISLNVSAFATVLPSSAGWNIFGTVRTNGINATLAGQDKINNKEAAMLLTDFNFVVAGNTVQFQATGLAGTSIDWNIVGLYVLST